MTIQSSKLQVYSAYPDEVSMTNEMFPALLIVSTLWDAVGAVQAASPPSVPVIEDFHANWAIDPAYIDKLARDANPHYAANKRLVLEFEAALERAQTVREDEPGNFQQVVEQYLSGDYVQNDPSFPPGRDGLLGFFKMIQKSGERVSHPPVMLVAEGDLVVLTMRRPPQRDPDQPSRTYTAYRIAIWRVCDHKLCEHWGPGLKGRP
jgi:predicted SnoaL-like aldol condensation-catalyzing enzyme